MAFNEHWAKHCGLYVIAAILQTILSNIFPLTMDSILIMILLKLFPWVSDESTKIKH